MSEKEEIQKEIEILENKLKPLQEKLKSIRNNEGDVMSARLKDCWKGAGNFDKDELIFSATSTCVCGCGLAYPKNTFNVRGSWDCANVLMGQQDYKKKHDSFPFSFYSIKSEDQPSANGATTRPK